MLYCDRTERITGVRVVSFTGRQAEVVEWQTLWTQNPLFERTCGFESRLRHQNMETRNPLQDAGFSMFNHKL